MKEGSTISFLTLYNHKYGYEFKGKQIKSTNGIGLLSRFMNTSALLGLSPIIDYYYHADSREKF